MPTDFYEKAFYILLAFVLGNISSWFIFGMHNVTKKDFIEGRLATNLRLDGLSARMGTVESSLNVLTTTLKVKKFIDAAEL